MSGRFYFPTRLLSYAASNLMSTSTYAHNCPTDINLEFCTAPLIFPLVTPRSFSVPYPSSLPDQNLPVGHNFNLVENTMTSVIRRADQISRACSCCCFQRIMFITETNVPYSIRVVVIYYLNNMGIILSQLLLMQQRFILYQSNFKI